MAKTLADLKRDAKAGTISLELLPVGHWADGVADRVKGIRKVVGANSVGITLERADGKGTSACDIKKASLIEYTDDSLKIYYAGYREPTVEEKAVLKEWESISSTAEFKERALYDAMTDCSTTYWQEKSFFDRKGMLYLMGYEEQRGCRLDINRKSNGDTAFIRDDKIKGEIELEYKVYHN